MGKTYVFCCYVLLVLWGASTSNGAEKEEAVGVYELKRGDFTVKLTNFGATVLSVLLPDKNGAFPSPLLFFYFILFLVFVVSFSLNGTWSPRGCREQNTAVRNLTAAPATMVLHVKFEEVPFYSLYYILVFVLIIQGNWMMLFSGSKQSMSTRLDRSSVRFLFYFSLARART